MDAADLDADPLRQVQLWLDDAIAAGIHEPNAMSLATDAPSVRTVLLKGVDSGLVFFTNYESAKGLEIARSALAAASLTWTTLGRQVRARGPISKTSAQESDDYFATRPRGSQLAAWASPQSRPIPTRATLDDAMARIVARYPEGTPVPRPQHWGGYRLTPDEVEFWSRRDDRLHDRIRYRRKRGNWVADRLAP